ncbi:MAG: acyl-CoA thioesterase [Halanaerobiaceae bacterium]
MEKKTISYSRTVMSRIMLPNQANPAGNVHGGEIMKLMDDTAYVVARKHSRENVVTARVDELQFHQPIYVDNLTTCRAQLVFVGQTSMEVRVKVEVQDLESEENPRTALTAFFTMVALDKNGQPTKVPPLILETEEEKKEFAKGKKRYLRYKNKEQSN